MNIIKKYTIKYSLILSSITSVSSWMSSMAFSPDYIVFFSYMALSYVSWQYKARFNKILLLWLTYITIQLIRGIFISDDYFSLKFAVINYLSLLQIVFCLIFTFPINVRIAYNTWLKFIPFIYLFWVFPFGLQIVYYHLLNFAILLLLFFFDFSSKKKIILILFIIFSWDLENRSHVIRIFAFVIIGLIYLNFYKLFISHVRLVVLSIFLLPIVLAVFGISGRFNIFEIDKYVSIDAKGSMNNSVTADTRTFLYDEVIKSSIADNNVIWGGSIAGSYQSSFDDLIQNDLKDFKAKRTNVEVGILGIYIWLGLIGVILYTLIFLYSCFSAVKYSKNKYLVALAIALAFQWAYSWAENMITPHSTNIMISLMIGMCISKEFQSMNDTEFKFFLNSMFTDYNKKRVLLSKN